MIDVSRAPILNSKLRTARNLFKTSYSMFSIFEKNKKQFFTDAEERQIMAAIQQKVYWR